MAEDGGDGILIFSSTVNSVAWKYNSLPSIARDLILMSSNGKGCMTCTQHGLGNKVTQEPQDETLKNLHHWILNNNKNMAEVRIYEVGTTLAPLKTG
jgi:hypothetical protein